MNEEVKRLDFDQFYQRQMQGRVVDTDRKKLKVQKKGLEALNLKLKVPGE